MLKKIIFITFLRFPFGISEWGKLGARNRSTFIFINDPTLKNDHLFQSYFSRRRPRNAGGPYQSTPSSMSKMVRKRPTAFYVPIVRVLLLAREDVKWECIILQLSSTTSTFRERLSRLRMAKYHENYLAKIKQSPGWGELAHRPKARSPAKYYKFLP